MDASNGVSPCGIWQLVHWRVVVLESAGVVGSCGEVDVVMAGTAGSAAGFRHEGFGLRGTSGLAVANFATAGIGGIDDFRKVVDGICVADDLVRNSGGARSANDAGQLGPHVDLVRHHFKIQRVAADGIGVLGLVAQDAHLHAVSIAAMERQLVVAGVATRGTNDIACYGYRRAIGNEVVRRTCVVGAEVERREIAVAIDGDGGGHGGIESRRGRGLVGVLVLAVA